MERTLKDEASKQASDCAGRHVARDASSDLKTEDARECEFWGDEARIKQSRADETSAKKAANVAFSGMTSHDDSVSMAVVAEPARSARHRELPFLIKRDGTWLYRGAPVRRKEMLCLFGSMLTRDHDGSYWLCTPTESGTIQVEDVPFIASELDFRGICGRQQNLCLRTNMDELLCVGPAHPLIVDWETASLEDCAAIPYVYVRGGEGSLPLLARLSRPVYYELVALAVPGQVEGRPCVGVWSQDCFFPLAPHSFQSIVTV